MDEHFAEGLVRINVSADRMEASLIIEPGADPAMLEEAYITGLLAERGVVASAETPDLIREVLTQYEATEGGRIEAVVARGREPIHGVDSSVRLEAALTHAAPRADDDSGDGRVDYHKQQAYRAVRAGERLATVTPAEPGQDGVDVHGRPLAAKEAKEATLRMDDTATARGREIFAVIDGLVEFTGSLLRVVRDLHVPGFVDFATGNIEFPGDVVIGKGVRDCFEIRVGGNLRVHDLVEAATIIVSGDAVLDRGMAGREKGVLEVGRDARAKYITNTRVDVGRDLEIDKELTNCQATIGRRLIGPRCAAVGGRLVIGGACEVAQVGSDGNVITEIVLGRIPMLELLLEKVAELAPLLRASKEKVETRIADLKRLTKKLTRSQAKEMSELEAKAAGWSSRYESLRESARRTVELMRGATSADLTVRTRIHVGSRIQLGAWCAELKTDIRGPVRITLSATGDPLITDLKSQTTSYLSQVARMLREASPPPAVFDSPPPVAQAA